MGAGEGKEPPRPLPSHLRQCYRACCPQAPPGVEYPFPGAVDHSVLSAAFPEELPVDLKHRKLGEQGGWVLGD